MEFSQFRALCVRVKYLAFSLGVFFCSSAFAANTLSETRSLELGLNHPQFNQLLESRINVIHGKLQSVGTWDNPTFEISREEAGDETETGVWLTQSFQLSGKRRLTREATQTELTQQQAANNGLRNERIAIIRKYFYQTLFYQQQHLLFDQWLEKVSAAESAISKREIAGDASGYDRRRISRERLDLLNKQRRSEAELVAVREQLSGLFIAERSQQFDQVIGELLPDQLPALQSLLQNLEQHSLLLQLQRQAEATKLNARAVERSYLPDLTLGIGHKAIDAPGNNESGLMLRASLPIPVFNRKQGEYQTTSAFAAQLQSEYHIVFQRLQADVRSLWLKADRQRKNVEQYADESVLAAQEIVEIAEVSYYASEIGVLELIDAYRSALEVELNVLQLALEARLTRIALDKMTEGFIR